MSATARAAISGVCSAGLAITALPAPRAAATWPVKIASGKFQGQMQTSTPRGRAGRRLGRVGVVAQEVDRLAHLGDGVGSVLPASRVASAVSSAAFAS